LAPLCIVGGLRRTDPLLPSCWLAAGKAALAGKHMASVSVEADVSLRSIPIIAVTSYALSGEEKKARAAGWHDYVPKPFSPRQLLAKIRHYLQ
jgi:CheY-like chemotaxis protein